MNFLALRFELSRQLYFGVVVDGTIRRILTIQRILTILGILTIDWILTNGFIYLQDFLSVGF